MHFPAALLVIVASAGSGCFYQPGSYRDRGGDFPGRRVTLGGCIDLSIESADDPVAPGDVVQYTFGNRCGARIELDLASIRATDDVGLPLVAYDPRRELRRLALEPHVYGHEEIEYRRATGGPWNGALCIELGAVDASAPRVSRRECFGGAS